MKTNGINDIDLTRWKEYDDIITDSLWIMQRDNNFNDSSFHGNFIPQIPMQLIKRYSKTGDYIVDPFVGSGTTIYVADYLNRKCIGIDLNPLLIEELKRIFENNKNMFLYNANAITVNYEDIIKEIEKQTNEKCYVSLFILHPPYHNIIKFSNNEEDLCNLDLNTYLDQITQLAINISKVLTSKGHVALVIGDKYEKSEYVPLGNLTFNAILKANQFIPKAVIVKNIEETTAKRGQENLWRYRALKNGFYIFKHEYIYIFQKK